jgi:hypothetical protein
MFSRDFRSYRAGSMKRVRVTLRGGPKRNKKKNQSTEPELVEKLGPGPHFVWTVYKRYRFHFAMLANEPKKCSAFLNLVAKIRMVDGGLWTDKALESMLRRCLPKGK